MSAGDYAQNGTKRNTYDACAINKQHLYKWENGLDKSGVVTNTVKYVAGMITGARH